MTPAEKQNPFQIAGWRNKVPSWREYGILLNLLPDSAFIFDKNKNQIIIVNSLFLQLTAFSQNELENSPIETVLPEFKLENLNSEDHQLQPLLRRMREPAQVMVREVMLDPGGQWWLFSLILPENVEQNNDQFQERIFSNLKKLSQLTRSEKLDESIRLALEITQDLFEADLVCIYQAESDYPQLKKIAAHENQVVLPDVIPSSDLIRLSEPMVWIPGKRVQTELHRVGRINNLSYIASTPLGQEGALFGLLIAGDSQRKPALMSSSLLEILSAHIGGALQQNILVENLKQQIHEDQHGLSTLNGVVDNTQEGIIFLSANLIVTKINTAAEWILGYTDQEVRGQVVDNVLIGPENLQLGLEEALKGIPTHNLGSVYLHRRSGQSFPAQIQIIPIMKDDFLQAIVVFFSDVSESEQIRIRTQQLEHRAFLGEFTAVFAHEVRNPINNISTGLQLLTTKLTNEDPNQEIISRMQADCTRLTQLMESVLSFSRPIETKFEPFNIGLLLQRILDRWRPRLSKVNVTALLQVEENLPLVDGDPRSIEQVFTNLISNAVDAMSSNGGTLAVKIIQSLSAATRQQIEVTVSDNGPGIPDEIRERIFEPFVSTKAKGTGLGLAITKRIITAHKGSITVNSFPGGTIFRVVIPAHIGE